MRIARPLTVGTTALLALVVGAGTAVVGIQGTPWGAWIGLLPAAVILAVGLRRSIRRWRWAQQGVPEAWTRWLAEHVPLYTRLDDAGRQQFERDVLFVMREYSFEGVDGASVTEDLRLAVAAGAATLVHGHPAWELPGTRSILFYPDRFDDAYSGGDYADYDGMAHEQGPLIFTVPSVEDSWNRAADGDNVVLHEWAHLFDFQNEGPDGVPSFIDPSSEGAWQDLVRTEMRRVRHRRSILRPYAAEAPSEFFAVAVEVFFEQPDRMARAHKKLFAALASFFNIDPRTGQPPSAERTAIGTRPTASETRSG